jgi:hypothetical protein
MRVSFYHTGTNAEEHFSVKTLRLEGPWAGTFYRLIDSSNLGDYLLTIQDPTTNELLYSRGFNSPFDAKTEWSSVVFSLRFPAPSRSALVGVKKRNSDNVGFHDVWNTVINPSDKSIDRTPLAIGDVTTLINSGPPQNKVDLAIIGDGYAAAERNKFIGDARRATQYLFSTPPYSDNKGAFNVRAIFIASATSGISDPPSGVYRHSALRMSYAFNGTERAIGTLDDSALREAAAVAPYEFILIITNSERYGGAADLQTMSAVAIDSPFSRYLVLHEFSHQFAGLDDEYFTLAACNSGKKPEPWRPNITANSDRQTLKWASLISSPSMAVPSPWSKKQYVEFDTDFAHKYFAMRDAGAPEAEVNSFIAESANAEISMLGKEPLAGQVGAFEGASNESCALFRPELDCMMFTINPNRFCKVCTQAILQAISTYAHG